MYLRSETLYKERLVTKIDRLITCLTHEIRTRIELKNSKRKTKSVLITSPRSQLVVRSSRYVYMYCIALALVIGLINVSYTHTCMYSQENSTQTQKLFHIYDHNRAIILCSLNLHLNIDDDNEEDDDDDDDEERKEEVRTMNGSCNV